MFLFFVVVFFCLFHPLIAVIINHDYFSVGQWNTNRRYLSLWA